MNTLIQTAHWFIASVFGIFCGGWSIATLEELLFGPFNKTAPMAGAGLLIALWFAVPVFLLTTMVLAGLVHSGQPHLLFLRANAWHRYWFQPVHFAALFTIFLSLQQPLARALLHG